MKKTIAILLVAIMAVGLVFADASFSGKFTSKLAYDLEDNTLAFSEPDNKFVGNFAFSAGSENEGDIYAVIKGALELGFNSSNASSKDIIDFKVDDDFKFEITEAAIYGQGWNLSILKADEMPKYAKGWDFARISRTALAIMKTAMFEILYMPDIPEGVSINEAVELVKKYDEPETVSFVNGILGTFVKNETIK